MTSIYIMELPEHKIMLYVSHPVADLFKQPFTRDKIRWKKLEAACFKRGESIIGVIMDVCWEEICYGCDTRMEYEGYYRVFICCNELLFSSFRIIDLSLILT
jgi:hypothetical protein